MKRKTDSIRIGIVGMVLTALPILAQMNDGFRIGISGGIGFPKISYTNYRLPVSVLTGIHGQQPLGEKWMLRAETFGLTTIHFGTWNGSHLPLKFNLLWASLNGCFRMTGYFGSSSWLTAGIGGYSLDQRFGEKTARLRTSGINIGLSTRQSGMTNRMLIDIRWHLLFRPSPNPQVFTITLGFLL
jgi:hypothetical protein